MRQNSIHLRLLIVCLGAILLLPGALIASPIHVIWSGNVYDGWDDSNTFGLGEGTRDLTGQDFTAEFVVDPDSGNFYSEAGFFSIEGGTNVGDGSYASPLLSASLTINGHSFYFQSDDYGGYWRDGRTGRSDVYTGSLSWGGSIDQPNVGMLFFDRSIPFGGLNETIDMDLATSLYGGNFWAHVPDGPGPDGRLFTGTLKQTHVKIYTEEIPAGPDVPEPASAVLLVSGLGAIALRFRRRLTPQSR